MNFGVANKVLILYKWNFDACLSREFFLCWRETTNLFEDKHLFLCGYKKTKAQRANWDVQSFSVINAEDVVFRNSNVPDSLIPLFQHHSVWINSRLFERLTGKELPVLHDLNCFVFRLLDWRFFLSCVCMSVPWLINQSYLTENISHQLFFCECGDRYCWQVHCYNQNVRQSNVQKIWREVEFSKLSLA